MVKVRTDVDLIDKFLTRGVDAIYPSKGDLRKKLLGGERIRVYQGFDPSGPFLHVGHAMGILAMRILQQLGHEVIFLVGDFTAKVGDPDPTRDTARRILSDEEIERNKSGWKEQAGQLIEFDGDNPVLFKHNYEWLSKLKLDDLIKLMSCATVQQILERDLFQKRLQKNSPIGMQELLYPLMQGYDSVAMEVDLELGGTDQTFNMLTGRTLVKQYLNKEKFVRAHMMMEAPDSVTMSKTKGNGINLTDSPENMYGKAMSYPDELIIKGLNLLTTMPLENILAIEKAIASGENPMIYKKIMALEIVSTIKGEKAAHKAQKHFELTVQQGQLDEAHVEKVKVTGERPLWEFIKEAAGNKLSRSEIKRVIEQGGVEVNGEKVIEPNWVFKFIPKTTVKFGKRRFFKVV